VKIEEVTAPWLCLLIPELQLRRGDRGVTGVPACRRLLMSPAGTQDPDLHRFEHVPLVAWPQNGAVPGHPQARASAVVCT